jgi:hypothetical protein
VFCVDINGDGRTEQVAWTSRNSDEGFLALDRNGNGLIDDGKELFGNFTPQPSSPAPNGFVALAEYDKRNSGGNENGMIDQSDAFFGSMRVWIDMTHGNVFRYRSKIDGGAHLGRWAWDIVLGVAR